MKLHIYRINGHWYCKQCMASGWVRLGVARNTAAEAYAAFEFLYDYERRS